MNDAKPTTQQEPKTAAAARKQPVHRIRKFRIEAAIWQHQSENGTWYNVTLSRSYKDANDEWKSADSFSRRPAPCCQGGQRGALLDHPETAGA